MENAEAFKAGFGLGVGLVNWGPSGWLTFSSVRLDNTTQEIHSAVATGYKS